MKIIAHDFLISLSFLTFLAQPSYAMFTSDIFRFDDPENAQGLHVSIKREAPGSTKWSAQEVKENDIEAYEPIFKERNLSIRFGNKFISTPKNLIELSIHYFNSGQPQRALPLIKDTRYSFCDYEGKVRTFSYDGKDIIYHFEYKLPE